MNKKGMKQTMLTEALERMKLLGIPEENIWNFAKSREIVIVNVTPFDEIKKYIREDENADIQDYKVVAGRPSPRMAEMIRKLEEDKQILVYYMICDQGVWPDGETFERISMLHVDEYINDYPLVKDECIGRCKTVPAYVYNVDEDFIELAEIAFLNVDGCIVQTS